MAAPLPTLLDGSAAMRAAHFGVSSEHAFVVAVPAACLECQAEIEVISRYRERGVDEEMGEAIERVTVFNVWDMDEGLRAQLGNWAFFQAQR